MRFDWWSFALQAVNFLVLAWLLWRFLYRPVRDVIEKRKLLAGQAFAEADARKVEAESARRRFEDDRAELARERQDMLKNIHAELGEERQKVLDEAAGKAEEMMKAARASIARERQTALAEIREQVTTLAVELASGIMRQAGSNAPNEFFLDSFEKQLEALPDDERRRLRQDVAPDGAIVTVATAAPLTPKEKNRWTDRLGSGLGQSMKVEFAVDPGLLGGAELRFPHAVIKFSWSEQLRKAEELLREDDAAS
jgi:F-type H+-transporting ATPase subunit b